MNLVRSIGPAGALDDVLTAQQHAIVLDLVRRHGPWDLVVKHHFTSREELIATTTGGQVLDPSIRFEDFLTPTCRGLRSAPATR